MQIGGDIASILIGSPRGTSTISLQAGEIVSAMVKDVTAEEALLLIRGQAIPARLETNLVAGQRISLKVQEVTAERIVFQQLDPDMGRVGGRSPQSSPAALLLAGHDLPATPGNLLLAETLIATGRQQLAPGNLQLLAKALGPDPSPAQVQGLLQLFAQGQPLSSNHRAAMLSLVQAFTGNHWPQLTENLFNLSGGHQLWENLLVGPGEENLAGKLAQLQVKLGMDHEMRLLAALEKGDNPATKTQPSAKESLLALLQGETAEAQLHPETANAARGLLQVLTGLQLLHGGQGEQSQFYLMGLLQWGKAPDEQNPFFLSFFQHEQGGHGPGEPSRQIMLKTGTPRLGSLLANLRIYGDNLSVEVAVDNGVTQKIFNQSIEKLSAMLEGLPWRVQILPCRLARQEQMENRWLAEYLEPTTPHKLDIRL